MKHRVLASFSLAMLGLPALVACNKQQEARPASAVREASPAAESAGKLTGQASALAFTSYQEPASVKAGGNCSLDAIDGHAVAGSVLATTAEATFGGWGADSQGQVPSDGSLLVLSSPGGSYSIPLVAGGDRVDVAAALNNPALAKSGFGVIGVLAAVNPGDYSVSIAYPGEPAVACHFNQTIKVVAEAK